MSTFLRLCSRAPLTTIVSCIVIQDTRPPRGCRTPVRRSRDLAQLAFELVDLVTQAGGFFEAKVARRVLHLVGQALDQAPELVLREVDPVGNRSAGPSAASPPTATPTRRRTLIAAVAHPD